MSLWSRLARISRGALLAAIGAYSLFPIYMLAVKSLKTMHEDAFGSPFVVLHPTLAWYADLFHPVRWVSGGLLVRKIPFLIWLGNTAIVFASALAIVLLTSIMGAYALGRLRPPGWRWWRRVLFATYLIPQTLLFLPMFHFVYWLDLDDSLAALILVYPMLAIPFCVWLLSAYFQRLSHEVEESAYIEGADRLTAFFRIVVPMSWPVIAAAGIFALGVISSDSMFALIFLPNQFHQTLASGLGTVDVSWEDLSVVAGVNLAALTVVPVCAVFAAAYVRGLTAAMIEGA
jgi:ABC-type glycerol-3-phosphate transport system permease component